MESFFSGSWQLKAFLDISPWVFWGFMIQFDEHIFPLGWFFDHHFWLKRVLQFIPLILSWWHRFSPFAPMQLLPLRPSFASCAAHGATLERDCKFSRRWEGHLNGMVPSVFVWFSKIILVLLYVLWNYVCINLCILMIFREIDILFICQFCLRNISLPCRNQ